MAKGFSFASRLKKTPTLLLCGVPLLALLAFSGSNAYWVSDAYDNLRIFQIILLMLLGIYAVFIRPHSTSLSPDTTRTLTFALPVLFGLIVASCWQSEYSARAAADAALYALLAISIWAQADLFRKNQPTAEHIAAGLAVLPLFIVFYFCTGLVDGKTGYNWHQSFANIRMLDDALLPCLFLLWQRPAWFAKNTFHNPLLNKVMTTTIYLISTTYILILWYDGARAALISIVIGLGLIAIFRRDSLSNFRLPLLTLFGAGFLFLLLKYFSLPNFFARPILRTGGSGREELWIKTLQLWQENPVLGVGGNNFVTSQPWLLSGHPHNLPLQWISEWGIAGLLTIFLLIPLATLIFHYRQKMPVFALGAVVAVGVNASLSGALVYPLSQMLGLWSLAWLVSLLPTHPLDSHLTTSENHPVKMTSTARSLPLHTIFKVIAVVAILAMLIVHGRDIICRNCMSIDKDNAPRFWQYGRALHLVPIGSEAITSTPDAILKNR